MEDMYRVFDGNNEMVLSTYREMVTKQTLSYVLETKKKYAFFPNLSLNIWDVFKLLDIIIDESDPDNDLPQYVHAFQTALSLENRYFMSGTTILKQNLEIKSLFYNEWDSLPNEVRKMYEDAKYLHNLYPDVEDWDWLILVGFIHDLGKVICINEFGNIPQWSVVGDTFPVGCKYSEKNVFSELEFYKLNPDSQDSQLSSQLGIYSKNCGLETLHFSYSHDEYMSAVLERNDNNFPKQAIYIIRFHSFYPWHTPINSQGERGYEYFASEYDWRMLPLIKAHMKADLYSKCRIIPSIEETKNKYDSLIKKYFNTDKLIW